MLIPDSPLAYPAVVGAKLCTWLDTSSSALLYRIPFGKSSQVCYSFNGLDLCSRRTLQNNRSVASEGRQCDRLGFRAAYIESSLFSNRQLFRREFTIFK